MIRLHNFGISTSYRNGMAGLHFAKVNIIPDAFHLKW
jgi:hypothetical protein